MTSSREQFEEWFKSKYPQTADIHLSVTGGGSDFAKAIYSAWQASRQCIEVDLDNPVCWRTYYADTDDESGRAHSESNEACARRIAGEIGGYVVPVYFGNPQK